MGSQAQTEHVDSAAQRIAAHIRTECLRRGWDSGTLAQRAGISRTTLYQLERGRIARPRRSTLSKIAHALELAPEELLGSMTPDSPADSPEFHSDADAAREFDRRTNPVVTEVCIDRPELFRGWSAAEWDELYSCFGTGGQLTRAGVVETAQAVNRKRETQRQLEVVLETHLADVAARMVETLYHMVQPSDNLRNTPQLQALLEEHRDGLREGVHR